MIKQAVIVNLQANMSIGRLTAQAAHASEMAFNDPQVPAMRALEPAQFDPCTTKVILKGWGESQLQELMEKAQSKGLPVAMMTEDGMTTALAIGPGNKNKIDKVTYGLSLL